MTEEQINLYIEKHNEWININKAEKEWLEAFLPENPEKGMINGDEWFRSLDAAIDMRVRSLKQLREDRDRLQTGINIQA